MFSRLFRKSKQDANAVMTLEKLNETLEMLVKKENVLLNKAASEVERAKEFTRLKNKRAALQCLKRKKLYEQQVEQLGNFQLSIHDQMVMLEGTKAATKTVAALRSGAQTMKAMQKAMNIDELEAELEELESAELEEQLLQPATTAPPVKQPARPVQRQNTADEDELAALQAEMAL
ncbi:hypothetical protein QVD17_07707 [Tagetes erecta]|uniref:Uncharacterized protein n=1 Tax=Tagetes erecta TaxID=13708 RepID=A0AAD8PCN6_TARER|nr:hypothetical protein QVD17_07707 [Tagetes erecta]